MKTVKDLPEAERPRERLLRHGTEALSLAELIAILLGTGTKGKSVITLAQELIATHGGLEGLLDASISELKQIKGMGHAKAITLKAAFGIAAKRAVPQNSDPLLYPQQIFNLLKEEVLSEKREILFVILKDTKAKLITWEKVAIGTLSEVLAHPREIFCPAIRHKAHSIIIAHNHPSGDPTPSSNDIELTKKLLEAAQIIGIALDDHIIIGRERFISLKQTMGHWTA